MGNTYSALFFHLIWSTKDRAPLIQKKIQKSLFDYIGAIVKERKGDLISIGGMLDHVHLLIKLPTSVPVSELSRFVKSNSSKFINEKFCDYKFTWQRGYGVFTVSSSAINAVKKYIENQEEQHRKYSYSDEIVAMLRKHDIEFDLKYLFL